MIAFVAGYLVIGIAYWQIPYSKVSLPDSLYTIGLGLTFISALSFCANGTGFLRSGAMFGCCAPAVVATGISIYTAKDATTHNLFLFEIAIAIVIGFSVSAFGAMLGVLIKRILKFSTSQ